MTLNSKMASCNLIELPGNKNRNVTEYQFAEVNGPALCLANQRSQDAIDKYILRGLTF